MALEESFGYHLKRPRILDVDIILIRFGLRSLMYQIIRFTEQRAIHQERNIRKIFDPINYEFISCEEMMEPPGIGALTEETYHRGISELRMQDSDLAGALSRWGNPPFWTHAPGFPGIVMAILAQQVSLESARAAFTKLENTIGSIHPEAFLSLEGDTLRTIGFSRQKASYVRALADEIMAGDLDLAALEYMDNDDARNILMELMGIGAWTADTYLLFSLRRPDAWPSGDLALAKAVQALRRLAVTPSAEEVDRIADHWKPWRAVAARILWHHYLCERDRVMEYWAK